jgi:cytidine deaminase
MLTYDDIDAPGWPPLVHAAREARTHAYAPYSRYAVGAAFACADGAVVAGCNVENASFGGTICAERNAICHAVATGRRAFVAAVIVTRGPEPAAPCGLCRQFMAEFAADLPILLVAEEGGARKLVRFAELLPMAFGPADVQR